MIKFGLHGAACAIAISWLVAVPANATSLREAVQEAVNTNPRIEAAQANYRATLNALEQARGRLAPEIDLSADFGQQQIDRPNGLGPLVNDRNRERKQVTITIRQALFDGWDRANDIYRSQARINAASYRILARSEAVALNAIEAYIDVNRHDRLLGLARKHVARHVSLLQIIKDRLEGGAAPVGDLEQTLERLEAARVLVAQIEIARTAAVAKFKASVGSSPRNLKWVPYAGNLPRSAAAIMDAVVSNNPELQSIASEVDVAQFEKEQFKSSFYPKVFLEGSATRGDNLEGTPGRNNELKGMVVLRWRLFDGGIRKARTAELVEQEYEKLAERDILYRDIQLNVDTAWGRYTKGHEQVAALKRQSVQHKKVIATYQDEYDANNRSLLDVLDAENANFATEFELSNVQALHKFASYQLLSQMGILLDRLGVEKPLEGSFQLEVPIDDPGITGFNSSFTIPPLR